MTPSTQIELPSGESAERIAERARPFRFPLRYRLFMLGSLATGLVWRWATSGLPGVGMVLLLVSLGGLFALVGGHEAISRTRQSRLFAVAALFFAAMFAVRDSPLLASLNALAVVTLTLFAAHDAIGGTLARTRIGSWLTALGRTFAGTTTAGLEVTLEAGRRVSGHSFRSAGAVLRGLLMATPVVLIFGALLRSADQHFDNAVASVFGNVTDLAQFSLDFVVCTLGFSLLTAALLLFALRRGEEIIEPPLSTNQRLGFVEGSVVLLSIGLLFASFLAVQLQHLFFENPLEKGNGITFAAYARSGFFELTLVSLLSGGIIWLALRQIRQETALQDKALRALSTGIAAQVLVMLVSAHSRLNLYEDTYGYTVTRLAADMFIAFLGFALLARLITLWVARHQLANSLVAGAVTTLAVFNLINPEDFVVNENLRRDTSVVSLDWYYLGSLSADAIPAIADQRPDQLAELCRHLRFDDSLAAWNLARHRAPQHCVGQPLSGALQNFDAIAVDARRMHDGLEP